MLARITRPLAPALFIGTVVASPPGVPAQEGPATADSASLALEAEMVRALGGREAWQRARVFVFTWAPRVDGQERGVRRHVWDRWTGRYRLELATREGQSLVALFNGNTREGRVWLDGEEIADDSVRAAWLDRVHAIYINDTYWLVMPFKWRDPGVHLAYHGRQTVEGREWEVVQLTFEEVGRTPRNKYYAYIDPATHRMEMWDHYRDRDDPEPLLRTRWTDWGQFGPITLASSKPYVDRDVGIYFRDIAVYTEVDETLFAEPGGEN